MGLNIQISDDKDVVRLLVDLARAGRNECGGNILKSLKDDIMGLREDVKTLAASEAVQTGHLVTLQADIDKVFDTVDSKLTAAEQKNADLQLKIDALEAGAVEQADIDALRADNEAQSTALAAVRASVDARLPGTPTPPDGGEVVGGTGENPQVASRTNITGRNLG